MAKGGYRPGAGRPKKSATKKAVKKEARRLGLSPLEYMLDVMNNPAADETRRDRMAIAAAPFVHSKAEGIRGKKEGAEIEAQAAVEAGGDDWGSDLNPHGVN